MSPTDEPTNANVRFTERLRLEPIGSHHADELLAIHQDPGVVAWYGETSRETAARRAAEWGMAWETVGVHKWMAYERTSGKLVGRGGLSRWVVDGEPGLEIGWALFEEHWGKGYATEIGRAGLEFAFTTLDADRVLAFTERHNQRSIAVMRRIGMTFVREFLSEGFIEGREGFHDDAPFVLYAIERRELGKEPLDDPGVSSEVRPG
jgi:RimJ/RimL family protein N-acetyltransferase